MKKRYRMMLGILLVVLSLSVTPKAAFAENEKVTRIEVGNEAEFAKAISTVNSASEGEYVISLTGNVEIRDTSIDSQRPVTILGNGHTLTVAQYASIHVAEGAKVKLGSEKEGDLKICSVSEQPSNDGPGLLHLKGTCDMYSGVSLSGRKGNNYFGGGVTVEGGTFHMHGGVIENCGIEGGSVCYGGGVAVVYGGKFIMDGGVIQNCYVKSGYTFNFDEWGVSYFTAVGGGVFVSGGSSFVMNGGTISENTATNMGGGIAVMASIDEIYNLQSSVTINGGTVESNSAQNGAGVFASAYYCCFAVPIGAQTPDSGQSENPGLYIDGAQICDNNANMTDGMGGGVLVAALDPSAVAYIGKTTVQKNEAAVGGGVMSFGFWTNMNIDRCTITGNEAANYGGGFAARKNILGGQTTITNTVLCNNIAGTAASDVYLDRAPLKLPPAEAMNAFYSGEPGDVKGRKIDGWYIDREDSRYTAQTNEQRETYPGAGDSVIGETGEVYLIAAAKLQLAKITFKDEDGNVIYAESWHPHGTPAHQIRVPKAHKASDDTYDYIFEAWRPEIKDVTGHAVYHAIFKKVFKKFNAKYEFNSVSDGERLPDEVKALLPADTTDYRHEENITAIAPSKTVVEVEGGQWVFRGFEKDTIPATMEHADATGNVTFVARWEFVKKDDPVKPEETVKPSETTTPIPEGNINLPQTGDNSDIALWSALLAVSAAALIGMAFRGHQKKTR